MDPWGAENKPVKECPFAECSEPVPFGRQRIAAHAADLAVAFPILEHRIEFADSATASALRAVLAQAEGVAGPMHSYAHPSREFRQFNVTSDMLPSPGELNRIQGILSGVVYAIAQEDPGFVSMYAETLPPKQRRLVSQIATRQSAITPPALRSASQAHNPSPATATDVHFVDPTTAPTPNKPLTTAERITRLGAAEVARRYYDLDHDREQWVSDAIEDGVVNGERLPLELRWNLAMAAVDACPTDDEDDPDLDLAVLGTLAIGTLAEEPGIKQRLHEERDRNPRVAHLFDVMLRDSNEATRGLSMYWWE